MLISPVLEEDRERRGDHAETADRYSHEYQTASELLDLMANNRNYHLDTEDETLSNQDLVLLYKNIDLGSKLISNSNEFKRRVPNQYVESIVYEDPDLLESDSDLGEVYSCEDIRNMMLINNERINLLTCSSHLENTVCHQFGTINLCTSELSDNEKFTLKEQICNTKGLSKAILPDSLLDYICYKRLEENYNFDMDRIIKYVKHTIEQLKRISNGDYLTEKVKEKWRKMDNNTQINQGEIIEAKVLANTARIPLYIERKEIVKSTKWDDLVHSSINVRSLSKIMEKKIILEVPKTLCESYKLFSKCCNENLIIKYIPPVLPEITYHKSRVDVIVQLNHSENVMSNSIMILEKREEPVDTLPLLSCSNAITNKSTDDKVTELNVHDNNIEQQQFNTKQNMNMKFLKTIHSVLESMPSSLSINSPRETNADVEVGNDNSSSPVGSDYRRSSTNNNNYADTFKKFFSETETSRNIEPNEDLLLKIQKLDMYSLPEETSERNPSPYNKKRSPTRNRIKSPYENKSHLVEEKKRRKLLEIKLMREKNKLALLAGCKPKRNKYSVPPQTANSVTKLSITNKSFYNSIYGKSQNMEPKLSKTKIHKERKDTIPEMSPDTGLEKPAKPPDILKMESQKYVNRNYYLDNAVTQIMDINENESQGPSEIMSICTNDIKENYELFSQLMGTPSVLEAAEPNITKANDAPASNLNIEENKTEEEIKKRLSANLEHTHTPNNSPLTSGATKEEKKKLDEIDPKKASTSAEFIKSIDKIYDLIHKLGKAECNDTKLCKSKFTAVAERGNFNDVCGETSTAQCTDSGTSVKHQLTSSNPSTYSFEKTANVEETPRSNSPIKKRSSNTPVANVVSKVVISAKSPDFKTDAKKSKKERPTNSAKQNTAESSLKAISQLLHDFEYVQKNRNKSVTEKMVRKSEVTFNDTKVENRGVVRKGSQMENRLEQHVDIQTRAIMRAQRYKPSVTIQQPSLTDNRDSGTRSPRKKVVDIVDEMKEARGEAVRGPSKLNSRINSLAQPKKIYVQAQIEEFQARYGKSIVTDRLQKLTGQGTELSGSGTTKPGRKKKSPRVLSPPSKQSSFSHSAVLEIPSKKTFKNSNKRDPIRTSNDQSSKQPSVYNRDALKKNIPRSLDSSERRTLSPNTTTTPIIPNDFELGSVDSSVDGSSMIENKIHHIIDLLVPTNPYVEIQNKEENTEVEVENETTKETFCTKSIRNKRGSRTQKQTDKNIDSNEKQLELSFESKREHIIGDTIPEENYSSNENTEASMLETKNSLCRLISVASFQKRLTPRNLALKPKKSIQKVLLLQSGDSNSVIMQSTLPQNLKITKTDNKTGYKGLSNPDWSIINFPITYCQTPIVGYSFPKYDMHNVHTKWKKGIYQNSSRPNKTTQCFKGTQDMEQVPERSQVDVKDFLTLASLFKMSSTVIEEEPEDLKCASKEIIEIGSETKYIKEIIQDTSKTKKKISDDCGEQITIPIDFYNNKLAVFTENFTDTLSKQCDDTLSKECVDTVCKERADAVSIEFVNETYNHDECCDKVSSISSNFECTASLDVLVGLLNEIKNITTCQSRMTIEDAQKKCENMENIIKSGASQELSNILSLHSLDNLRKLESSTSILSFYLSNNDKDILVDNIRPLYVDKEVNAVMPTEFINKCTGVPSLFFPLTSRSTNVSNSLIGFVNEPSNNSVIRLSDPTLHSSRSLTNVTKIIKLSKPEKEKMDQLPIVVFNRQQTEANHIKLKNTKVIPIPTDKKVTTYRKTLKKNYVRHSDFDPTMKIKRDVLVTVYSVLVFTVFAALSFPNILYRA